MSSSQTTATTDGNAQNQTTDDPSQKDDWQDHIAKIIEYSDQLKEDYKTQGKLTHQLAKAEWKLSLRSGYGVYDLFGSVWLSFATAALAQIICLIWLWRNTVYLSNKIGFSKTIKSVKQLLNL